MDLPLDGGSARFLKTMPGRSNKAIKRADKDASQQQHPIPKRLGNGKR